MSHFLEGQHIRYRFTTGNDETIHAGYFAGFMQDCNIAYVLIMNPERNSLDRYPWQAVQMQFPNGVVRPNPYQWEIPQPTTAFQALPLPPPPANRPMGQRPQTLNIPAPAGLRVGLQPHTLNIEDEFPARTWMDDGGNDTVAGITNAPAERWQQDLNHNQMAGANEAPTQRWNAMPNGTAIGNAAGTI